MRDAIFEFTEAREFRWAYSSVGLEHTPDKREVGSSNLPRPTNQVFGARCPVFGTRGRPRASPNTENRTPSTRLMGL